MLQLIKSQETAPLIRRLITHCAPANRLFRSGKKMGTYISGEKTRPERRIPELKKWFCREVGGMERKEFPRGWRKHPGIGKTLEMGAMRGCKGRGCSGNLSARPSRGTEHWGEQVCLCEGTEAGKSSGLADRRTPQHPEPLRAVLYSGLPMTRALGVAIPPWFSPSGLRIWAPKTLCRFLLRWGGKGLLSLL